MVPYLEINHIHVALLGKTISTSSTILINQFINRWTASLLLLMFYNQVNEVSDSECVYGHWH